MIRRYKITLVGSEEPNGSRIITTPPLSPGFGDILFSVSPEDLKDYVPNAGDTLVRDVDSGDIRFERQE